MGTRYSTVIFLCLVASFFGCMSTQRTPLGIEAEWKRAWIELFFQEYREYVEVGLKNCHNSNRDQVYDIERKVRAFMKESLDLPLRTVAESLRRDRVTFDSIRVTNVHSSFYEGPYNTTPIYIDIFSTSVGTINVIVYKTSEGGYILEDVTEEFEGEEEGHLLTNGCGYGYLTETIIDSEYNCTLLDIFGNHQFWFSIGI